MEHNVYVSGGFREHLLELVAEKVPAKPNHITIDFDSSITGRGFEILVTQYINPGTDHVRSDERRFDSLTSFMNWLQEDEIDDL